MRPSGPGRPRPDDRLPWDVLKALQEQGTLIERLRFEFEAHLKDGQKPLADFLRLVMDPENGLVVKVEKLQTIVGDLRAAILGEEPGDSIHSLRHDVKNLKEQKEDRRWRWGVIIVPLVAGLGGAVLGAALAAWMT